VVNAYEFTTKHRISALQGWTETVAELDSLMLEDKEEAVTTK